MLFYIIIDDCGGGGKRGEEERVTKIFGRIDGEMGCRMGIRMHTNRTLSQLSYGPILNSHFAIIPEKRDL